jgi:hypothetical protein
MHRGLGFLLTTALSLLLAAPCAAQSGLLLGVDSGTSGGGGGTGATFIAQTTVQMVGGTQSVAMPGSGTCGSTGACAGDLLVMLGNNVSNNGLTIAIHDTSRTLTTTQVTGGASGYKLDLSSTTLTSGEITSAIDTSAAATNGGTLTLLLYRGPTVANFQGTPVTGAAYASNVTLPGFTPSAGSAGVIAWMTVDRNQTSPTTHTGWAARAANALSGGFFSVSVFDLLSGTPNWTDSFTPFSTGGSSPQPYAQAVELVN